MKRLTLVALASFVATVAACGLNPQPFPPDNPDGSAVDAAKGGNDANAFGDTGTSADSSPTPETDGGEDVNVSDGDASTDARDAETDADADIDADDGGSAPDAALD